MTTPQKAVPQKAPPLLDPPNITLPVPTRRRVCLVDVEDIEANGANNVTLASMSQVGQLDPVMLEEVPGRTELALIDGKRRVTNARKLGWTDVDAEVYPPLTAEQRAHLRLGLHRRAPNNVDEARALLDLARSHSLDLNDPKTDGQLASITRMEKGKIRRLLKIARLPADLLEMSGTVVSEGVLERVASLSGTHLTEAIRNIRTAGATEEGRFTQADLKDVQLARNAQMGEQFGASLPPLLTLSPVDALASEVRIMASERNVAVADLILALGQPEEEGTVVDAFSAAFGLYQAAPDAVTPIPLVSAPVLEAVSAPWEVLAPAATSSAAPWETEVPLPASEDLPVPAVPGVAAEILPPIAQVQALHVQEDVLPAVETHAPVDLVTDSQAELEVPAPAIDPQATLDLLFGAQHEAAPDAVAEAPAPPVISAAPGGRFQAPALTPLPASAPPRPGGRVRPTGRNA